MWKTPFSVPGDRGELAGYRAGAGPHVLMLHGGPGLSMDYLEGLAGELADRYEVAVFQQRGLAPSTENGPFTIARAVADVAAILNGLRWERSLLLGHSWGGHLALHVALSRPELLTGVVALDPVGAADDGGLGDFGEALTARAAPERRNRLEELHALPDDEATEADHLELLGIVWPGYFADPALAGPVPSTRASPAASAGLWADLVTLMPTLAAGLGAVELPMTLIGCTGSPIPSRQFGEPPTWRRTLRWRSWRESDISLGWSSPASSWPPWTAWLDVPTCRRDPHTTTLRCPP